MPVPGTPFETISATCVSERCRTLAFPAMLIALSLPRPSSPWHPAHDELKVAWPAVEAFGPTDESFSCANKIETWRIPIHKNRESQCSMRIEWRIEAIVKADRTYRTEERVQKEPTLLSLDENCFPVSISVETRVYLKERVRVNLPAGAALFQTGCLRC